MQQIRIVLIQHSGVRPVLLDQLHSQLELVLEHCPVKDGVLLGARRPGLREISLLVRRHQDCGRLAFTFIAANMIVDIDKRLAILIFALQEEANQLFSALV